MAGTRKGKRREGEKADATGSVHRTDVPSSQDVTERNRAEEERERLIERLRQINEQLTVTGLKAKEQAEKAEARLRQLEAIIEAVPDGVMILDGHGNVMVVNSALVAQGGFANRDEALRPIAEYQQFLQICYPDGRPYRFEDWPTVRALRGERAELVEGRLYQAGGSFGLFQVSAAAVLDERGKVVNVVTVSRDVTEQRRWERHRDVLFEMGQALNRELDTETTLQTVMEQTLHALGADTVHIFVAEPERRELVLAAYRNLSPETVQMLSRVPFDSSFMCARAFATDQIHVMEDTSQMAPELIAPRVLVDLEDLQSLVAVPLKALGRSIGVMVYGSRTPRRFAPEDLETVARVADMFGMAIENSRLYGASQRRTEELEEERKRREEFVSVTAHELRSPMTVLGGYAQVLRRWETLEAEQRGRALTSMSEQVRKLNRLVNDLLDFSRIEAGRFSIERAPTEMVTVAKQVVDEQQVVTTRHRIILEAPDGPMNGNWDKDRVTQALSNLVSNAVKYSPKGGEVRVVVRKVCRDALVSVSDQGIGIAKENIPLLFQPYSRFYREREVHGVGLGLYITKGIIEAHGGRIWAESEPGKGSIFYFTLPMEGPTA